VLFRECFPNVITPDVARNLSDLVGYLDFSDHIIQEIVQYVVQIVPAGTEPPSYVRVSDTNEGTPWHDDYGTASHMSWCEYSASILLTPPSEFTGGGFYFEDKPDDPVFHYCDLMIWSNADRRNRHCVARSRGNRVVLLMFFQGVTDG